MTRQFAVRAVACAAGAAVLLVCVAPLALRLVPLPPALREPVAESARYEDRDGRPLREVPDPDGYRRRVALDELPSSFLRATVAAEDRRFWSHGGVDLLAVARAARDGVRQRRVVSGASTITQQLIKRASGPRARTAFTKVKEMLQAWRLEQVWSKERILTEYVNRVDYGNRCIGVAAAARYYFDKPPRDLSEAESALLAGLPQAPDRLNPHRHPERAVRRLRAVLARMESAQYVDTATAARLGAELPQLAPRRRPFVAPQFVNLLRSRGGAHPGIVRTTLDLGVQEAARAALAERLADLRAHNARDGAVVVLENATGDVLALVGSDDWYDPDGGQINGAWIPRASGSAVKPFTYLLALERGWTAASVLADTPCEFPSATGVYRPVNYDRRHRGPVRLREALACSLNIPAVRMLDACGGPGTLMHRLRAWGITTWNSEPDEYGLGLTIGNAPVRLLELANAYATLARGGVWLPCRFTANDARSVGTDAPDARTAAACWIVADVLRDNLARSGAFGARSALRFDFPVACKTGTSTGYRDNWCFGFTREYTVGVWVGNFDQSPMQQVSGVDGAAPVMRDVMNWLHRTRGTTWFPRPSGVVSAVVDPVTGLRAERGMREWFLADVLPRAAGPADFCDGRWVLGPEYGEWLGSAEDWLGGRAVRGGDAAGAPLRVVSPVPGSRYYLDADVPGEGRRLPLRCAGAPRVIWRSDTLRVTGNVAELREGRHRLEAEDPTTGRRAEAWVEVGRL